MALTLRKKVPAVFVSCLFFLLFVALPFSFQRFPSIYPLKVRGHKIKPAADPINATNYHQYIRNIDLANSSFVFNSIFAALRQSASDLFPAGLTYFGGIVPKGTLLYRTGKNEIPKSYEWLAFDSEFSYSFGIRYPSYGRNSSRHWGPLGGPPPKEHLSKGPPKRRHMMEDTNQFFTFRTTRDLDRIIYFDGASAAKSETGEMDTQKLLSDVIGDKLNLTNSTGDDSGVGLERLYAERICQWGKPLGLDGYVRVEVGFELVLCDFLDGSVEVVSNISVKAPNEALGIAPPANKSSEAGWPIAPDGSFLEDQLTPEQKAVLDKEDEWQHLIKKYSSMQGFDWLLAGARHDTGEPKVVLDYRYMVTGINRTEMKTSPFQRRLLNERLTYDDQLQIVDELERSLSKPFDPSQSVEWKLHIEEIMTKFGPMLKMIQNILTAEADLTEKEMAVEVTRYTFNFILRFTDSADSDINTGKRDAIFQYIQSGRPLQTESDYLIWSSIANIVTAVVDTLYSIHQQLLPQVVSPVGENVYRREALHQALNQSRAEITKLLDTLQWAPLTYQCDRKCEWDEICYTPSWGPSPLPWISPTSKTNTSFTYFDANLGRQVVREPLQCVKVDHITK
ncbi:uncharacterized protein KNAG_0F02090 [Huiozyma naganishii CBS 8797]|uniref:Uncharacterized protein n=1 Tax=Huiozyma naganishii (strain ATCC MYA-139 / BCRC 22969 / CBS 8797 / KCTC 17520 / NBRC 10181 / NCYC 3082 / Yp74L-3) TaxID=1071383 RepID=J7S8E2_HUIN7|nr:hypothetical protein KNAG_0F02090 [Kazachstania naganishii CBS 8797]CCK70876.1 hypothetical protein KNAG_0F02090 [Kazachstania naganishii CBS 8797]